MRERAPSRKKRYPILFRNHRGIPEFVNFPKMKYHRMNVVVGNCSLEMRRDYCYCEVRGVEVAQKYSRHSHTLGNSDAF